jgi:predicted GH43/DUF377 family glycosyl hydrolase
LAADGDTIRSYSGAADSCIGLATASLKALLAWLEASATDVPDPARGDNSSA